MGSVLVMTPKNLVIYLAKHYGYVISHEIATDILIKCTEEYDDEFSEEELMEVVEQFI